MELFRMGLVFAHLMAMLLAGMAMAFGDYALLGQDGVAHHLLRQAARAVMWALAALLLTGLGIIWLETQFDLTVLLSKPKLLAKLTVVAALLLNGIYLHTRIWPSLFHTYRRQQDALLVACRASQAGATSAATWGFAMFLGVARPLTPIVGYTGFMALYGITLLSAWWLAQRLVRPRLAQQLKAKRLTGEPKTLQQQDMLAA